MLIMYKLLRRINTRCFFLESKYRFVIMLKSLWYYNRQTRKDTNFKLGCTWSI